MMPEVAPVRAGEEIDVRELAAYLRGKVEGIERGVTVEQFPGGHSNLTYLVRAGDREYVLRRPPLGPVAPKAHDMAREYRVLAAVHPVFPPAPRVFLVCEDPAVIGATFFLMERRHGVVLRRDVPTEFARRPDFPRRASQGFIDCLSQLHLIDIEQHGLRSLGKPEGFLERQVHGWSERWERAKTEELPGMDPLLRWLVTRMPEAGTPTLVHNDFKLDNIMLDARDPGRVEAVLDWEMTTVGEPLADLGCTLCYWTQVGDPEMRGGALSGITAEPGWLTRAELVERYAKNTGRDTSNLGYYEVFGLFKLGVILQQIYFRYHRGQTRDERFRDFHLRVRGLMRAAVEMSERLG
ncbi:MAG TPA: phosphotransferase family protein [Bryobacteraceae bacterium]|nr:phosphotransferase family protein [Bryobacteraceae bacterium]